MTAIQPPSAQQATPRAAWGPAVLAPVAATVGLYSPMLLFRPNLWEDVPGAVHATWFALLVLAAPIVATLVNRRRPVATSATRAWLLGVPQLPLALGLMWLDIWLDVRSGYLLAGSGEVEMALGFGTVMATVIGVTLMLLVAAASRFGATRNRSASRS